MNNSSPNLSAILRGEQRSASFQYRHTFAGAAHELGIPTGWVWFWYSNFRLRAKSWLRRFWVRLDHVQALLEDEKAVYDAFYATGEPISDAKTIREVLSRWPSFPKEMYVSEVPKQPAASVTPIHVTKKEAA